MARVVIYGLSIELFTDVENYVHKVMSISPSTSIGEVEQLIMSPPTTDYHLEKDKSEVYFFANHNCTFDEFCHGMAVAVGLLQKTCYCAKNYQTADGYAQAKAEHYLSFFKIVHTAACQLYCNVGLV